MLDEHQNAISRKILRTAAKLRNKEYRDSFVEARCRRFLAHQMRALRDAESQVAFGKRIDKPQSVVSRLEDPSYGKWTLQTLLDVASSLDCAVVMQFVDWKTFLSMTQDDEENLSAPAAFSEAFGSLSSAASVTAIQIDRGNEIAQPTSVRAIDFLENLIRNTNINSDKLPQTTAARALYAINDNNSSEPLQRYGFQP